VIGPIGTWQAIDPIALQGKCFVISSSPEASYIGTNPYSFIAAAPVATWHRTFWEQAYADPDLAGVKTVAVLTPDPNLYDSFVDAETAVQESHGRQVVIVKRYTQFTQDYYPILTPVLAKNPDVVSFCGGNIGDEDLMLKQLRELGFKGIIAGPAHGNPASAAAVAGCAYTEGYRNNDPDYSSTIYPESVRALHAEFQTLHPGQALALTTCIGFYGVQLYVDAMKKAGTTDTDAVMKVFDDPNFSFDHFGQTSTLGGLQTYGMNRIINDEVCYSKVINCENVMISRLAAVTP